MAPGIDRGDRIVTRDLDAAGRAGVRRGQLITFRYPPGTSGRALKRVIAVGGDTVECSGTGPVKVNGKALDEPYIIPGATPCADKPFGKVTIPKGHLWVMGDNRSNSLDSRYHQELAGHGTVPENQVVGRAFAIAWPINRWAALSVPGTFDQSFAQSGMAVAPTALGFAGAVPLVLVRRRRLLAWLPLSGKLHPHPSLAVAGHEEATLESERMRQALLRLASDYRIPLVLYTCQEFSVAEIASTLGISPAAVKQRAAAVSLGEADVSRVPGPNTGKSPGAAPQAQKPAPYRGSDQIAKLTHTKNELIRTFPDDMTRG